MLTRNAKRETRNAHILNLPSLEELHEKNTVWLPPLNQHELAELKRQVEDANTIKTVHLDGGRTVIFIGRADLPMIESWSKTLNKAYNQTNITVNLVHAEPLGPETTMQHQPWHIDDYLHDHIFIGVALTDVTNENGPMEFENGFKAVGPAGSRWLYTQRIKHRGTVNKTKNHRRSILLIGHAPKPKK
jgi:hypothetical protein